MVFVNYIAGMKAIPFFLRHAAADQDVFTLTDVVFPGFLFIMGVSIPLALARRKADGTKTPALLGHVIVRTLALLFLGVLLVNEDRFSAAATGIGKDLWYFLATLAVFALWAVFPQGGRRLEKTPPPRPEDRRGGPPRGPGRRLPRPGPGRPGDLAPDVLVGDPGHDRLVLPRRLASLPGLPRQQDGPGRRDRR